MARSTKEAWLDGPGDLKEADVEDVPVEGQTVRVRGLSAAFSSEAQSAALEQVQQGAQTISRVNAAKMEAVQFHHGCIDPQFTLKEAHQVARKYGPAFKKVIAKIDELSGVDKEAITEAEERFPASGSGEESEPAVANANGAGNGEPAVRV